MPPAICCELISLPVLLIRSHKSASRIVRDLSHVVGIPVKSGDTPVVVASVEHDQVDQLAEGEVSPNSKKTN